MSTAYKDDSLPTSVINNVVTIHKATAKSNGPEMLMDLITGGSLTLVLAASPSPLSSMEYKRHARFLFELDDGPGEC